MDTRPFRMLSGSEIVAKGRNVTDCILPEVGTKEVISNGSWLEKKQIQTALEARKALVAAERIDKIGALSHAEWRDSIKLAEVTQQVGSHWPFIGHNVNGTFFLLPEEALYLIETNGLLLKHNDVTVSLQKAYNLLLDSPMTLSLYKVYASLSRVGYKVFRHNKLTSDKSMKARILQRDGIVKMDTNDNENSNILETMPSEDSSPKCGSSDLVIIPDNVSNKAIAIIPTRLEDKLTKNATTGRTKLGDNDPIKVSSVLTEKIAANLVKYSVDDRGVIRPVTEDAPRDIDMETVSSSTSDVQTKITDAETANKQTQSLNIYKIRQLKIENRKIQPSDPKSLHEKFKDFPDFYNKQIVKVNVPREENLPRNIFLNNTIYVINVRNLKSNIQRNPTAEAPERNRAMYRTLRSSSESESAAIPTPELPQFLPSTPPYQQPFGYFPNCRPHYQPYQRPVFPWQRFNQHPYFYRMMHTLPPGANPIRPWIHPNVNRQRFQRPNVKHEHLQAIKHLAKRLKNIRRPSNVNMASLIGLVARFNEIYNERMQITRDLNIIRPQDNIETIELDNAVQAKPKLNEKKFEQYLNSVKELAARLKNLERKNQSTSKYRRALCNLLKNFNKAFDAEIYLDAKGELIDKKLVVVDSSSDSDVVATDENDTNKKRKQTSTEDDGGKNKKRKVLRNPFSVLKEVNKGASTSQAAIINDTQDIPVNNSKDLSKYFNKNWLRDDDDFGKPYVCSKMETRHLLKDSQQLYDYLDNPDEFKNWVDLKLSYYVRTEAVSAFEHDLTEHSRDLTADNSRLKPILQQDITDDWSVSLEKLRIIKTNTDMQETSLSVHFDVYNRDVQNFRKTDPPKPHFRIVCVDESSKFPSGAELRALHANHDDNVSIVFAIVGVSSIAYLQMNPIDLPVNVGND